MKTLFAKLSAALLVIVTLIGSGFFIVEQFSTRLYYEEITQRLNASIAMYVTGERQLIEAGVVNGEALALLAQQAMIINPTVEIYLLDTEGAILAHALPPESVLTNRVDLAPVRELMGGEVEMPLRGTDPRNIDREKIFIDPGIGFGKTLQHNLKLLKNIDKFVNSGYRVLAGTSRKSFVGVITGREAPADRVFGTAATVTLCVEKGVSIVRVHDVANMMDVVKITQAINKA